MTTPFRWRLALLPLLAALLMSACQRDATDASLAGGASPAAALRDSVARIRQGDFVGFWQHALPPADYANLRADWRQHAQGEAPITDEERARFSQTMRKLTAPDAKATLNAQLQPQLAAAQQNYGDQLPLLIGIGRSLLTRGIAANPQLNGAQKQQAADVLTVLAPWAQRAAWFDPARAQRAIGVAVDTARALKLDSADQLRSLDFDGAMARYSVGFDGLRQALAIYGLPVNEALDSVTITPTGAHDDRATLRVDYRLLDRPLSTTADMLRIDGRWYSEALVHAARQHHASLLQPAPSASAPPHAVVQATGKR